MASLYDRLVVTIIEQPVWSIEPQIGLPSLGVWTVAMKARLRKNGAYFANKVRAFRSNRFNTADQKTAKADATQNSVVGLQSRVLQRASIAMDHSGRPETFKSPFYCSSTPRCFMKNFMSSQTCFLAAGFRSK